MKRRERTETPAFLGIPGLFRAFAVVGKPVNAGLEGETSGKTPAFPALSVEFTKLPIIARASERGPAGATAASVSVAAGSVSRDLSFKVRSSASVVNELADGNLIRTIQELRDECARKMIT
jgi:hypothetical protein